MTFREWFSKSRGLAGWLAAGMCLSVAVIAWFGYRAVREWRRSSMLLVERRTDEAADLLVTALTHDMRAVQKSVLSSADWDVFMLDPPYDVSNVVASAFARYPYPETFFAGRGELSPETLTFFTRSNRTPVWAAAGEKPGRFPVAVQTNAAVARSILDRIGPDAVSGRRFSIFEITVGEEQYQVIVRLLYGDQLHEHLDGIFGFMVNISWVRQYYFPELTDQVARIGGTTSGLALSVIDENGHRITGSAPPRAGPASRRSFPLMFFDPLLVAVNQPRGFPAQNGLSKWEA